MSCNSKKITERIFDLNAKYKQTPSNQHPPTPLGSSKSLLPIFLLIIVPLLSAPCLLRTARRSARRSTNEIVAGVAALFRATRFRRWLGRGRLFIGFVQRCGRGLRECQHMRRFGSSGRSRNEVLLGRGCLCFVVGVVVPADGFCRCICGA